MLYFPYLLLFLSSLSLSFTYLFFSSRYISLSPVNDHVLPVLLRCRIYKKSGTGVDFANHVFVSRFGGSTRRI